MSFSVSALAHLLPWSRSVCFGGNQLFFGRVLKTQAFRRYVLLVVVVLAAAVAAVGMSAFSSSSAHAAEPAVGVASNGAGGGWVAYSDGAIVTFGGAQSFGDMSAKSLNKPIVGIGTTPDHLGYWLVASDGGVFAFGNAQFFGSTGSIKLNQPVVGISSTPDGKGYWLVASDGGIFAYGNAQFFGSTGSITLNKPMVSMASTVDGKGYWLVAADGGIFAYGNAQFNGSAGSLKLNQPIVGMSPTADGKGYSLVARDGGVFAYGNAPFLGSLGSSGINNIAGFVTYAGGYILVDSAGKTYPFNVSINSPAGTTTSSPGSSGTTSTTDPATTPTTRVPGSTIPTPPTTTPAQQSALVISSPDDYLGLGSRLVFSTVKSEDRPARSVTLTNTGAAALTVNSLVKGGAQAGDFQFSPGQATPFTLAPGEQRSVSLTYHPAGGGFHVKPVYVSQATLTVNSSDAVNPNLVVSMGGVNAADYGSFWEPNLQDMFDALGYDDIAGVTDKYQTNAISPYTGAAGDEVVSAYWTRADTSQPAAMYPLAHTSGKAGSYPSYGWYAKGSGANNYLYSFPGQDQGDNSNSGWGQNQMLLPGTTTATRNFSPAGSFGFVDSEGNHSDDNLNQGNAHWHNIRWYPAKLPNGAVIPNTWIVADDIGGPANNSAKNWDYQDYVFLMTNVKPDGGNDQPAAKNPLTQTIASFNGNAGGISGSGFTSAQGSIDANKIAFNGGNLQITTSNDSNTVHTNALQLGVNAGTRFQVSSRLVGPFDSLNAGAEQQGIYFGPDGNNYIKAEVEWSASDNSRHLTVWRELNGSGQILQTIQLPGGNANFIDLIIAVDGSPQATESYNGPPIVTVSYAINGGANTAFFTSSSAVPTGWLTYNTPAGVVASHQEGGSQFVATYANFAVVRSY